MKRAYFEVPLSQGDGLPIYSDYACSDCDSSLSSSSSFLTSVWKGLRSHRNQRHGQKTSKSRGIGWSEVKLQTFLTGPKSAFHYFCLMASKDKDSDGEEFDRSSANTGRPKQQLVEGITEQWAYEKSQQEELQKVFADGALRHETTNWLKRAGWSDHFRKEWDRTVFNSMEVSLVNHLK